MGAAGVGGPRGGAWPAKGPPPPRWVRQGPLKWSSRLSDTRPRADSDRGSRGGGEAFAGHGWGSPVCSSQILGRRLRTGGRGLLPTPGPLPPQGPPAAGAPPCPRGSLPSQPSAPPGPPSAVGEGSSGTGLSRAVQRLSGQGCWEGPGKPAPCPLPPFTFWGCRQRSVNSPNRQML